MDGRRLDAFWPGAFWLSAFWPGGHPGAMRWMRAYPVGERLDGARWGGLEPVPEHRNENAADGRDGQDDVGDVTARQVDGDDRQCRRCDERVPRVAQHDDDHDGDEGQAPERWEVVADRVRVHARRERSRNGGDERRDA